MIPLHQPVSAQSAGETTTFFFKDYLSFDPYNYSGDYDLFGFIPVSQTPPTKQEDSKYPPSLFIKNTTKILPRYELNSEQWLLWFTTSWILYFFDDLEDFNLSDLFDFFGDNITDEYDITLLFPNPFRIVEVYDYMGSEQLSISEDVQFNLFFSTSNRCFRINDQVRLGLYTLNPESLLPLPKLIANTTEIINTRLLSKITQQTFTLENINYTLNPGESLLFSIEIIPDNRTVTNAIKNIIDINRMLERFETVATWLEARTRTPKLQDIGAAIKEFISIVGEFNITSTDLAEIVKSVVSPTLLYDSAAHPASVTVPFTVADNAENTKVYYLHQDNQMDETKGTNNAQTKIEFSKNSIQWQSPALIRSKILLKAAAQVYINPRTLFRKPKVTAVLYQGTTELAQVTQQLSIDIPLISKMTAPVIFEFNNINKEIDYGTTFTLELKNGQGSRLGIIGRLYAFYDSETYPSSMTFYFNDTDNIQYTLDSEPDNQLIVPGKSVKYTLNITSKKSDNITIQTTQQQTGSWDITIVPKTTSVEAGKTVTTLIYVNSTEETKKAYGDTIEITFVVSGKTGIARKTATATVSENAIQYNVSIIDYTKKTSRKRGENATIYFIIQNKNTGAIDDTDSYSIAATSANEWKVTNTEQINNLQIGATTDPEQILVVVNIPKNTTLESDTVTIRVTSDTEPDAYDEAFVTITVTPPDILESIYEAFESAAKTLGLDTIFGTTYAPIGLAALIMVSILFILIILAAMFTRRDVELICIDRIQEIDPSETAAFDITIRNTTRKTQTYELQAIQKTGKGTWDITITHPTIILEPKQEKTVTLTVTPQKNIDIKDWVEIQITVSPIGKKKKISLDTMITLREGQPVLQITDVTHWPIDFSAGDRVETSLKLWNKGNIAVKNARIILYINGKQKNKAQVSIPGNGYAEITLPWIAVKGKNTVRIKTIE